MPCAVAALGTLVAAARLPAQNAEPPSAPQPPAVANDQPDEGALLAAVHPSGKPIPEWGLENELMTEDEESSFRRADATHKRAIIMVFRDALKSSNPNDAQREAIRQGARWYLARFTMPKYRGDLFKLRQEVQREVGLYTKTEAARQVLLEELTRAGEELIEPRTFKLKHDHKQNITLVITELMPDGQEKSRTIEAKDASEIMALRANDPVAVELFERYADRKLFFDGQGGVQNFLVRLNVIYMLIELDRKAGNVTKQIPAVPYVPVADVLLRIMNDSGQIDAFRIAAVNGLSRICLHGEMERNDRRRVTIVDVFLRELKRDDIHWWYRKVLLEALATVGILHGRQGNTNPAVAQTLSEHLANRKHAWLVRCAAAKALGRAPLDSTIDLTPIAYEIVELAHQMAQQYNKKPRAFPWKNCYLELYFAFKPLNKSERTSDGRRSAGLMIGFSSNRTVREAYEQLIPMIRFVLKAREGQAIPTDTVTLLGVWLKNNQPSSFSIVPNGKPIVVPAAATKPAEQKVSSDS